MAESAVKAEKKLNEFRDALLPQLENTVMKYDVLAKGENYSQAPPKVYTPTKEELKNMEESLKKVEKITSEVKDFAVGCIPIYGSGRDISRGWKKDDWLLFSFGCIGLGLDLAVPGVGKSAAKGVFRVIKGGEKVASEVGEAALLATAKETIEISTRKGVNNSLSEAFENTVKATTGRTLKESEMLERNKVFEISKKMMRYDETHSSGEAVYETVTKSAREFAEKGVQKMSVLLVDLNNFKAINDSIGRELADNVISAYEKELMDLLKGAKSVGYGREEVVFLLPFNAREVAEMTSKLNSNMKNIMSELGRADKEALKKLKDAGITDITAKIGICEIPVGAVKPKEVYKKVGAAGVEKLSKAVESQEEFSERLLNHMIRATERAKTAGELSKIAGNKPIIFTNELNLQSLKIGRVESKANELAKAVGADGPSSMKDLQKWVLNERTKSSVSTLIRKDALQELNAIKGGEGVYDELCSFALNSKGTREVARQLALGGKHFTSVEITSGVRNMDRTLKGMNNTLEGYSGGDQYIKLCFKNMRDELASKGYKQVRGTAEFVKGDKSIYMLRRGSSDWISFLIDGTESKEFVGSLVEGWRSRMAKDVLPCRGLKNSFLVAHDLKDNFFKKAPGEIEEIMSPVFKEINYNCKDKWKLIRGH